MPPKKVYVERGLGSGRRIQKGYLRSVYDTLTSPENSGMVTAVTAFGVGVAFLASPLAGLLLPG